MQRAPVLTVGGLLAVRRYRGSIRILEGAGDLVGYK